MKILVTGSAGFIGSALVSRLLESKVSVVGIDNLNDYYDVNLKKSRLNVEKVVNAPRNPIVKNIFKCSLSTTLVATK